LLLRLLPLTLYRRVEDIAQRAIGQLQKKRIDQDLASRTT